MKDASPGDLRLVSNNGSTGGTSGQLEVFYGTRWGTVCENSFEAAEATVACLQLG